MFAGNNAFSGFGQQQPAAGGLFNTNKPNTGNGLFGNATQQQPQGQGIFGGTQPTGAFGQQQQPNTFMQPAQQAQGLFGNQPQTNAGGGIFGNNSQPQTTGIFGAGQQQQPQQGIFGQQQPQQSTGLFGGNQQQQTGGMGIFGGGQQTQTQAGVFGQPQQQTTGIFGGGQQQGAGLFGQPQQPQQQAGNLFGGSTQGAGTGLFGAATSTANTSFLGQQPQQQQQNAFGAPSPSPFANTSVFGGQQQGSNVFGGQPQQQQQQQGGLFNTFAPNNAQQQQGGGMFQQQAPSTGSNNMFGNTGFNNPAGTSGNTLGGTSWGVPTTMATAPSVGGVSVGTQVQPVKSKNGKLDAKHQVKCIAALDQFNGLSKEEIRISFIQSGGQQPTISQQQPSPAGFATNTAFKNLGTGLGAQTSLPSFGGIASNNTLGTQGNALFGQQQQAVGQAVGQNLFNQAKPAFGQTATTPAFGTTTPAFGQGTSLFGQQPGQQQGTSLFGGAATQPQQQATGLFGQAPVAGTTSIFGQTPTTAFGQATQPAGNSLFGGATQPTTSLFGTTPQQQTPSLFGQPAQQTPSLFGQPAQQQPSTSLFGGSPQQTTPSLFGGQPATTTLFGQTTTATPLGQTPSLFAPGQPTVTPAQSSFFNQAPTTFNQLASPLYQGQQAIDPSLQMLLPQLLLSYALNQPQAASSDPASNPTFDLLSKLTTLVGQLTLNQNQSQSQSAPPAAASTPFDEFMREAKNDRLAIQKKESENAYSLFSEFEKEPNYYLESAAFPSYERKRKEEPQYTLQAVHKVPKKQDSFLSTNSLKQAARGYRSVQDEGRRKINEVLADLPKVGGYGISPSLERLKGYSSEQLRHVEHLRLWNHFGEVEFLEPVSVYRADLASSVTISKDNIEITDPELEDKRMRMTFRNFGNYANLKGEEREKIVKRMRKWIAKYEMREVKHDEQNGDLVVEVDN